MNSEWSRTACLPPSRYTTRGGLMVHAHGGVETARLGALPRHEAWVVDARTVLGPSLALGAVAHLV